MKWPALTRHNRWVYFILTYLYVVSLYLLTNHQHWRAKHYLPLTPIDVKTPYWPWTSWIYVSVFILPLFIGGIVKQEEEIKKVIFGFLGMSTFCTIVFIIYPTVYPRPESVMDMTNGSLPLIGIHLLDSPANCIPSQHVAMAFLSAFFLLKRSRVWGNLAIILAVLISFSTLTTKQHYVWDVVTGYLLARISYWMAEGRQHLTR